MMYWKEFSIYLDNLGVKIIYGILVSLEDMEEDLERWGLELGEG